MIDLFRPYLNYPRCAEAVAEVLRPAKDGRVYVGEGVMVERFEERIADLLDLPPRTDGEPRILAVNSCTMALTIALDCIGVGPGDEVISTPITCTATSGVIVKSGATIVWADVDRATGNIDPADVARKMSDKTKAVVAVDWGGRPCNYWAFDAELPGLPIIRDAAHSFLSDSRGALLCPPKKSKFARLARWHGLDRQSTADFRCAQDISEAGYRGHMTDDMAAVGLANAERVEWVVSKHRENAAYYDHVFRSVPGITPSPADPGSSYWLYTLICDDRDGLQAHLERRDVASSPVHAINTKHAAFARQSRGADSVPNAEAFDRSQLSIPVGWWIGPEEREQVAKAVIEFACQRVPA